MALVRCPNPQCGTVLFDSCADIALYRHRGRGVVAASILRVECDRCGAVWQAQTVGIAPMTAAEIQEALAQYRQRREAERGV